MKNESPSLRSALAALAIGLTAPLVYFLAGEAVETPGKNPPVEIYFPAILGMLYMAYCLFWITPTARSGLRANWHIFVPALLPLLLLGILIVAEEGDWFGPGAMLASAIFGSLIGFRLAFRLKSPPRATAASPALTNSLSRRRGLLLAGAGSLAVVAPLIAFAVIPPLGISRFYATGFRASGAAHILGWAAGGSLVIAVLLARVALRPRANPRPTITVVAILSLLLGLFWAFASGILRSEHPDLLPASRALVACAACSLLTAVLVTVASIVSSRAEVTAAGSDKSAD
jgi:hypothetical protein